MADYTTGSEGASSNSGSSWSSDFGNVTDGLSSLGTSVAAIIGAANGNQVVAPSPSGTQPYPQQVITQAPKQDNTILYVVMGLIAFIVIGGGFALFAMKK